jgi:hypothetical protein
VIIYDLNPLLIYYWAIWKVYIFENDNHFFTYNHYYFCLLMNYLFIFLICSICLPKVMNYLRFYHKKMIDFFGLFHHFYCLFFNMLFFTNPDNFSCYLIYWHYYSSRTYELIFVADIPFPFHISPISHHYNQFDITSLMLWYFSHFL